jgi:hypothetical protein
MGNKAVALPFCCEYITDYLSLFAGNVEGSFAANVLPSIGLPTFDGTHGFDQEVQPSSSCLL